MRHRYPGFRIAIAPDTAEAKHLRRVAGRLFSRNDVETRRAIASAEPIKWAIQYREALGLPQDSFDNQVETLWDDPMSIFDGEGADVIFRQADLIRRSLSADTVSDRPSLIEGGLNWLSGMMRLEGSEQQVLGVLVRIGMFAPYTHLANAFSLADPNGAVGPEGLAAVSRLPVWQVMDMLAPEATLCANGLVIEDEGRFLASPQTLSVCAAKDQSSEALERIVFGRVPETNLAWGDFSHVARGGQLVRTLMADALARNLPLSILLHGSPGTGKTTFAAMLAQDLGARAVFVGETDDDGGEPVRGERIAHFKLASRLAHCARGTILVVDEAEDVLGTEPSQSPFHRPSRIFTHRMLEEVSTPVIWITNQSSELDEAVLRRMSFAIEFPQPSKAVRKRIIGRVSARQKVVLDNGSADRLADFNVSPGLLATGIDVAARLAGSGQPHAEIAHEVVAGLSAAAGHRMPPKAAGAPPFVPELCRTDCDIGALVDSVGASSAQGLTFLFHGAPGTGKSEMARYLAQRLERDVIVKRSSDLLSKWVGEAECNIANAFQEAFEANAMLVIDEADSFLGRRDEAGQSWEVSIVNEMLTWLEAPAVPVVMTTNWIDRLDPASLRRFIFKLGFQPMGPEEISAAFRIFFNAEAPAHLLCTQSLTPGDFAVIARRARVIGGATPDGLAELLLGEAQLKPGQRKNPVGFTPRFIAPAR